MMDDTVQPLISTNMLQVHVPIASTLNEFFFPGFKMSTNPLLFVHPKWKVAVYQVKHEGN